MTSPHLKRLILGSLVLMPLAACVPTGAAPNAPARLAQANAGAGNASRATAAGPATFRYQLALDQLALGDVSSARVLAEAARKTYGDSPEINMLLAYLLQREGRAVEAKAALESVRTGSPLAAAQSAQLSSSGTAAKTPPPADRPSPSAAPVVVSRSTVASLPQADARLAALERYLVGKVNEERRKAGLAPLTIDSTLANTSRAHSAEMRDRKYFAHESPTENLREPLDRYRAVFNDTPSLVAENIYRSWGSPRRITERDIDEGHASLMKSPGHRANILLRDAQRIGVGIVANSTGDFWITEMFARD